MERGSASAAQEGIMEHRVSGRGTQHGAEIRRATCRNATTMSMQAIVRDQGSTLLPTPCRLHAGSALRPALHAGTNTSIHTGSSPPCRRGGGCDFTKPSGQQYMCILRRTWLREATKSTTIEAKARPAHQDASEEDGGQETRCYSISATRHYDTLRRKACARTSMHAIATS